MLVKASAGGGGRGMRIVRALATSPTRSRRPRAEAASAFGDGTVFVEPYVEHGRHVEVQVVGDRHGDVLVARRARLLDPASAPEGRRGGAGARTRRRTCAPALHDAARGPREAIGYVGAGTVEFLYDPSGAVLLPGDEHPAPGRAPGHRGGHRHSTCRAAARRRRGRRAVDARASRRAARGTPSRSASTPRTRPHDWQPQSGRLTPLRRPRRRRASSDRCRRTASGSTPASSPATRSARTTTPCSPRSSRGRRPGARRCPARRRAARGPSCTALRTNRDLLVEVLRHDGVPRRRGQHRLLRPARRSTSSVAPTATPTSSRLRRRAWRWRRGRGRRAGPAAVPVGWRNVVSAPAAHRLRRSTARRSSRWPAAATATARGPEPGAPTSTAARPGGDPRGVVLEVDGVDHALRRHASTRRASTSTSSWGHVGCTGVPRFIDPADQVAERVAARADAGLGGPVAVSRAAGGGREPVLVLEAMKMQHTITAPTTASSATSVRSATRSPRATCSPSSTPSSTTEPGGDA